MNKQILLKKFRESPEKYWKVELFTKENFERKICSICKKGFWSLIERENCPEHDYYGFIGNPITKVKWDYIEAWVEFKKFFIKNKHTLVPRYPVVSRWHPNLFFTIASIQDFQRIGPSGLIFEYPANPLIVPQVSLRFNDIENVGVTGKHLTSFIMAGQHAFNDDTGKGYWKDECLELNFEFLTEVMKIPKEEIIYMEDIWAMPDLSAFGPCIEAHSKGLELVNNVFMEFTATNSSFKELPMKVVDVGWGFDRLPWFTQGLPTVYDVVFGSVINKLKKITQVEWDQEFFNRYAIYAALTTKEAAKQLKVSVDELERKIAPFKAVYGIADHSRTLTFAIADGLLPSNVGGGYNLRVILRRALSFIDDFRWDVDLFDVCELHTRDLRSIYPELSESLNEIQKVLDVEKKRFHNTKLRTQRIVEAIIQKGEMIDEEKLVKLYDSEGITPELVQDYVPDLKIPIDFYVKVTEKHMSESKITIQEPIDVSGLPATELLVYEDSKKMEFQAKVLRMINEKYVVLDKTYFYPESGGQKSDVGFINNNPVSDVQEVGDVVVHRIMGNIQEGKIVNCAINQYRRESLTKNHDAVHIINVSAREVIGQWIWQAGSEVNTDKARLDMTHFENLTDEQIEKIEEKANEIIKKNLPIKIEVLPRIEAEKKYGFRIYQGGAVPKDRLRIISIGNIDHECCGGTHGNSTKDVGIIIILRTKRIQDGVNRIEFSAGDIALKYLKEQEKILTETAKLLKVTEEKVPEMVKELFETWKAKRKELRKLKK